MRVLPCCMALIILAKATLAQTPPAPKPEVEAGLAAVPGAALADKPDDTPDAK